MNAESAKKRTIMPKIPHNSVKFIAWHTYEGCQDGEPAILGTGFVISLYHKLWGVTAKHPTEDVPVNDIMIPKCTSCQTYYEVLNEISITPEQGEIDTDFSDIFIYELADNAGDICCDKQITPLAIKQNGVQNGDRILVRGYPNDDSVMNKVEFDEQKIKLQAANFAGHFIGPATSSYCFRIQLIDSFGLKDYDGISGSPVYVFKDNEFNFIGMMLRGQRPSAPQTIVSSTAIIETIERYLREQGHLLS